MKNAKKNNKTKITKSVARRKVGKTRKVVVRKPETDEDKAHREALRAAKKQQRISTAIGVNVQTFSGDIRVVSFPGTRKRKLEIPAETLRTLRSKVTGEIVTLIHNGVARLNRLTDRLDFTIRDPRDVQFVRINTEGLLITQKA